MVKNLRQFILEQATGFRCGVTLPYQLVKSSSADLSGLHNVSLPEDTTKAWQTASGSMNRNPDLAIIAAIAEAMERYSAAVLNFPVRHYSELVDQEIITQDKFALFSSTEYRKKDFPWKPADPENAYYGEMYSLYDNHKVWIPQELIGLGPKKDPATFPSTSTGLAAHSSSERALLCAIQELLERDALAVYWLNSLGGREIQLDSKYIQPVVEKSGQVFCFDITQKWNPHPVVMVCGYLKQRNKKRISMGVACKTTYEQAVEKAYVEWVQGCIFSGFYDVHNPDLELQNKSDVVDFNEHAVYYTIHPQKWKNVPLLKKKHSYNHSQKRPTKANDPNFVLQDLLTQLNRAGIQIFYRDVTTPDVQDAGLVVMRTVSPQLSLIHGDERTPFLGGRTNDVKWRYPDLLDQVKFPNHYPHPLG